MPKSAYQFEPVEIWDERTARAVAAVRSQTLREPPLTISQLQIQNSRAYPVKGPTLCVPAEFPRPNEEDVRKLLLQTIDELGKIEYVAPSLEAVRGEWLVCHENKEIVANGPKAVDLDSFQHLAGTAEDEMIIFYVHGGAYIWGSSGNIRPTTTKLSQLTGSCCLAIDYRLSPQNPFPAALLDILVAYLSLLYSPPGSPHRAIPSSRIVLAGDSAGGNLCLALIQFLLHQQRRAPMSPVMFHGQAISFPLPTGVSVLSLYDNHSIGLPSAVDNEKYDLFGPARLAWLFPGYPKCEIWPTVPPRSNVYCHDLAVSHPLVSMAMAKNWNGAPPIWLACGEEMTADYGKVLAQQAASQGVKVVWEQYEALPHQFPFLPVISQSIQTKRLYGSWAKFCRNCVTDPGAVVGGGTFIDFRNGDERDAALQNLLPFTVEEAQRMLNEAMLAWHSQWSKLIAKTSRL